MSLKYEKMNCGLRRCYFTEKVRERLHCLDLSLVGSKLGPRQMKGLIHPTHQAEAELMCGFLPIAAFDLACWPEPVGAVTVRMIIMRYLYIVPLPQAVDEGPALRIIWLVGWNSWYLLI